MNRMLTAALAALALSACAPVGTIPPQPTPAVAATAEPAETAPDLAPFFAGFWEEYLQLYPLEATFVGDRRYNDRLPNVFSAEFRAQQHAFHEQWLQKVRAIDTTRLDEQDRISVEIFVRDREEALEAERYPGYLMPLNQFYSFASLYARLGSGATAQPFETVEDYDMWLRRAERVPVIFAQAMVNMREGMRKGIVQPRALMEKVLPQLDALIVDKPEDSLFWRPIADMPEAIGQEERERLAAAYRELIAVQLMPAYVRLRDFVRDEYLPKTRTSAGLDGVPDGEAWYAFNVRRITTTDLTPAQIHQIGLDEVARIHAEMKKVIAGLGFDGDLHAFFRMLQTDPRFQFASEEALLAAYNGLRERVDAGVPKLFSVTPRAGFEIRPVEAFRAKSAAGGSYETPSEDGTRPGIFYVNTYDLPTRKVWDMEDLYLHEAIPGHHFQLALQQELKGVPAFRRFGGFTAFIEGWGLYAESLGKALGVYEDPYQYFGYLQNELWRAIRLVVDTGLHSKHWTREQVIAYMLENSAESETQATAEAERYMAIPGQALAYKVGELKIKQLRAHAEAELGDRFDIRAFHAAVLEDGALPLDVLEQKIERWIKAQR